MSKSILVVDDSGTVRQQVTMALKGAGFTTIEAVDGQDGLAKINGSEHIDMVICDVNMPNMNGLEMVEAFKGQAATNALPVIMLTTEGQPSLIKRAKEAGAAGWIVKPFDANQLIATAKHLTGA
jgi:two-component system chemotaxis response regulator CheY